MGFEQRFGKEDKSDANLLWWLGYARFGAKDYTGARSAFTLGYAKWPAAVNSQWYIALANFYLKDATAAVDAMVDLQFLDPVSLNRALSENLERHLPILDSLVLHCIETERVLDAARLSAAQGNAAPDTSRYWNNMGLFYRDAGNELPQENGSVLDPELQRGYFSKALEGYERALALKPADPLLLNDTAVILHYCLETDLLRAREMYLKSSAGATRELARDDLAQDTRDLLDSTLRDSQKNLTAIDALIARRAAEAPAVKNP